MKDENEVHDQITVNVAVHFICGGGFKRTAYAIENVAGA